MHIFLENFQESTEKKLNVYICNWNKNRQVTTIHFTVWVTSINKFSCKYFFLNEMFFCTLLLKKIRHMYFPFSQKSVSNGPIWFYILLLSTSFLIRY